MIENDNGDDDDDDNNVDILIGTRHFTNDFRSDFQRYPVTLEFMPLK